MFNPLQSMLRWSTSDASPIHVSCYLFPTRPSRSHGGPPSPRGGLVQCRRQAAELTLRARLRPGRAGDMNIICWRRQLNSVCYIFERPSGAIAPAVDRGEWPWWRRANLARTRAGSSGFKRQGSAAGEEGSLGDGSQPQIGSRIGGWGDPRATTRWQRGVGGGGGGWFSFCASGKAELGGEISNSTLTNKVSESKKPVVGRE